MNLLDGAVQMGAGLVVHVHHHGTELGSLLNVIFRVLYHKVAAVRRYFNSATKELNNAVETFPSNLIAGMFGFKKEVMFDLGEQRATLEEAPKIKF
jgi:hypothetical protein